MNLIPFVCCFILVFSYLFSALIQSQYLTIYHNLSYTSFLKMHRVSLKDGEEDIYKYKTPVQVQPDPSDKKEEPKKEPQPVKAKSKEDTPPPFKTPRKTKSVNSRLNIALLFQKDDDDARFIKEVFERLIRENYGHTTFYQNYLSTNGDLAKDLVKNLCEQNSKLEATPEHLLALTVTPLSLQRPWYLILRGTSSYDWKKEHGWPPLSDLVLICTDTTRKPLCFRQASLPVLSAFFTEDVARDILLKEEEKHNTRYEQEKRIQAILTTDELASCIKGSTRSLDWELFNQNLTCKAHKVHYLEIEETDPETGITVRKVVSHIPHTDEESPPPS